jgi:hypothetical protein
MKPGTVRAVRQAEAILCASSTNSADCYTVAGLPLAWTTLRTLVDGVRQGDQEHASRQAWAEEAIRLDVWAQTQCDQLNDALDLPPGTPWADAIRYLHTLRANMSEVTG